MSEAQESLVIEQLQGLEPQVPNYDYEGLRLPEGLIVDAFFGSHVDVGDLAETRAMLKSHDIVVIENAGCDESSRKLLQKVVKGNYAARERLLRSAQMQGQEMLINEAAILEVKALYDIHRPLITIDPPFNHPIVTALMGHYHSTGRTQGFSPDFKTAVNSHRGKVTDLAKTNFVRENYMLRSFCEQFSQMAETDLKFAEKLSEKGVSIAMFNFGLTHAGLYTGIQEVARRNGVTVSGTLIIDTGAQVLADYDGQACGRYTHGLEIDDLLVAKDMVTKVLTYRMLHPTNGTNVLGLVESTAAAVRQVDTMDIDQLEELYLSFLKLSLTD